MDLAEPYTRRAITPLNDLEHDGWRCKVYGIAYRAPHPRGELVAAGFECTAWLETVLANPGGPDLDAYFDRRLDEDI